MAPKAEIKHTDLVVNNNVPVNVSPDKNDKIIWNMLILLTVFHMGFLYAVYAMVFKSKWQTLIFAHIMAKIVGLGVTAGAHRLWSHRTYKARLPLQIMLLILYTISLEGSVITWVWVHRMHHKYSETDADPHNADRGFIFAHMGWLLVSEHPETTAKANTVDISDVINDPLLHFQRRYYTILGPAASILPCFIPLLWGESLLDAFAVCGIYRCVLVWHGTALVNSWAHFWGNKPYDKYIKPVETKVVAFLALGEGYHNYHHTFPWDYKSAEIGNFPFNNTKVFIEIMAKIGWAYDLKFASPEMIQKRAQRTGDGSMVVT